MESSRILVTGLPKGTTENELTVYFQSVRDSGGGDVKKIEIEGGQAFLTFEDVQAASSVVGKRKHLFKGRYPLIVSLLPEEVESSPEDEREDTLTNHQEKDSRDRESNQSPYGNTQLTNEKEEKQKVGEAWPVQELTTQREGCPPSQCTVKVTGLSEDISEDLLTMYFESTKRSKGGPVRSIDIDRDLRECFITFESPDDAARTKDNSPHKVNGLSLEVTLFAEEEQSLVLNAEQPESDDEASITIVVSGDLPSEDALLNYFDNARRSGGGEVLNMDYNDEGDVAITFAEVEDLKRLLEGPHTIDKKPLKVIKQPPKKKVPLDPLKVHVQGLNEKTTKDSLCLYLEKFSKVDVTEVYMGCNNNAMAVFDAEPDFVVLFEKVTKDRRGLEGKHVRLDRVPVCSCIHVKGLRKETSDETIALYFENMRRSGGGPVSLVERLEKDQVLVYFENPSSLETVIKRSHVLERQQLDVKPYYPFLENSSTNKTDIAFEAEVYDYVNKYHQRELQALLEEQKVLVEFSDDSQRSTITIFPSEKKKKESLQSWQKRVSGLETFLNRFKKVEVPIGAELFDEMVRRWKKQNEVNLTQGGSSHIGVSFNKQSRCVQIIGREKYVAEEEIKFKQSIDAAHKDTELMKSIVEVEMTDIPESRLALLKMCDIDGRLQNKHQHLTISIDLTGNEVHLKGPRSVLQDVQLEIYRFSSNVTEESLELPANVIAVLKNPQVSDFITGLLKEKEIQALFIYDHNKSSNEVLVVGAGSTSVRDAGKMLQDVIQERSLQLTDENTIVLESHQWKAFLSNLTSTKKVGIFAERYSSTLWVCGIAEDVQLCFDRVKQFLDENTILHDTFRIDQGKARFIFEKWGFKLDKIKKDLATCCVDLRAAPDCEGIEVSGTEEGLEQCVAKLKEIEKAVQKDSISIDKPGMKKFILEEKGSKSLRAIEKSSNCLILTSERNEHELSFTDIENTTKSDYEMSSAEFMCSYLTIEGKKVSVFKGDITKQRVDAIVNAANSQLQHVGGLARAIVTAGGQEIQSQCNEYIQDKGDLLEGQTMITTAGALPCDKVIHTVGPRWDSWESQEKKEKKKKLLRYAITNCLKTAKTSRSIAIPAVSSGVYSMPLDVCAEVILDAVFDFCATNPSCQLTEIHLVNNDEATVKAFVQEMRKRFSGKTTFVDNEKPSKDLSSHIRSSSSGTKGKPKKKSFFQTTRCINIAVKVGDLAKEKADILVGTAGQDLNLSNNPCARALSEAAGQCLQQQCTNNGPVAEGDITLLSQTGNLNCRAVIFAVCSHWNDGRGKETLRTIIKKCLQEADKKKMTSIAFAAIGTGVLQFPRDQVADLYFDEVVSYDQKNPKTSLRDVRFVLFHKDAPTIQAFKTAELTRQAIGPSSAEASAASKPRKGRVVTSLSAGSLTFSPMNERRPDQLETTVGPLCFQVQAGDITKETTEAIAVISNCDLDIAASGTGAAILRAGGDSITKECSKHGRQTPGSVVVTKAGKLKARYLYHIIPADQTPDGMKHSVLQCLQEAENYSISSISFPAIGTGNIGISAKACAHAVLSAIQELSKQKPVSLQLIKMTVFQESMLKDIRSAMEEASGVKPSQEPAKWRQALKSVANVFGFGSSDDDTTLTVHPQELDNREIYLEVVAGCKEHVQEASKAINELIKEKCKQKVIDNEEISNLTPGHLRKLHTLELRYSVQLTVEKEVERIVIDGQYEDVLQVFGEILELLHEAEKDKHERNHAEMLSKDIQWKYEEDGTFEDYDGNLNAQIELAFQKDKSKIEIQMDEENYTVKFDTMTMEDEEGIATGVKRIDLRKDVEFPPYWTPQPTDSSGREETVHLVQLDSVVNAEEYKKVSDQFHKTCPNNILKIERVQNPALYGAYIVYKQTMDKAGGRGSNEMNLFHGTKGQKCQLINHKGFNRSFCGENAACYGNGVYFALQASYSARSTYSPPDTSGFRYMYLVKVLVGEYTVGRQGILTPPVKNASNVTDTYDTVVDNVANPGIFVVFYDWQCYPEYLITFQ